MNEQEISCWSQRDDDEHPSALDSYSAVHDYLFDLRPTLPETLKIVGFVRPTIKLAPADILHSILGGLDEEYGDEDGTETQPTPRMLEAATELARVIAEEYEPWTVEPAVAETVDVRAWCAEHKPEWLGMVEAKETQTQETPP